MNPFAPIVLRTVEPSDLDTFYVHQIDPDANWMAAFVGQDPTDRLAFQARWARNLPAPQTTTRTILAAGQVAGHIACFPDGEKFEVTYWLGRAFWGHGVATRALQQLLDLVMSRPIFARAAKDNLGSIRVLQKCGFEIVGEDRGFAAGRGADTDEFVLRLDHNPASAGGHPLHPPSPES